MLSSSRKDEMQVKSRVEREFGFTEGDYRSVRDLLKDIAGISLSDSKKDLVYGRLARILRQRGLSDVGSYLQAVRNGSPDDLTEFVNALTTNVTSFFREPHQFEFMASEVFPELFESNKITRKIRFWSSACSTGQEPYSISIVMKECIPESAGWDAKLLATDLDSNVLATAKAGIYDESNLKGIDQKRRKRWFKAGKGKHSGLYRASPELQELISFRQLNLMDTWPMKGSFDAIFCRNVVIYFTKDTQRVLFDKLADMLAPGRFLFIGHSETLMGLTDRFKYCGNNVYRKVM